jgi:hypothetical protein
LHWEKDFIKIYYDGYLIFEITNPEILEFFNKKDSQMRIILNNGKMLGDTGNKSSKMEIKKVNVYAKRDIYKWSVKPTDAVGSVGCKRLLLHLHFQQR